MDLLVKAITLIKNFFNDEETIKQARLSPNFFTRERKIKNFDFLCFVLVHAPTAMATSIRNFFVKADKEAPSKQAVSKKRSQVSEWAFKEAFHQLRDLSMELVEPVKRFGYYILAIDGSILNLPKVKELLEKFGTSGRGGKCPCARMSACVDIMSGFILGAAMVPYGVGERALLRHHLQQIKRKLDPRNCVLTMDRGYFSRDRMEEMDRMGFKFVMRVKLKFSLEVDDASTDSIVTLDTMRYRVVKFVLDSDEVEVLVTNLLDMDYMDLFEIYSMRWGVETTYLKLKSRLQLENFTGKLPQVVLQDFWTVLVQYTILNIQASLANREIVQNPKNKYTYKVNFNNLVGLLRENLVQLLMENEEKTRRRLRLMADWAVKERVPVRPGRRTERKPASSARHKINIKYN